MENKNIKTKEKLQWHPAFFAGIQIELKEYKDNLIFENEHQLGTKPKEIDVLIIKKQKDIPIRKNIGKIFRKYNIVEYKSPNDYLSIDDYYKVCAYAFFYKSDTSTENEIGIEEITITFVSAKYPKKLFDYLKDVWEYDIIKQDEGIYFVKKENNILPQQFIVTSQVGIEENIWLRGLTNNIDSPELARDLFSEYRKNRKNILYESVMDIIMRANSEKIDEYKEVSKDMCKALDELMSDRLKEELEQGRKRGIEQGIEQGIKQGIEQGIERGIKELVETVKELSDSKETAVDSLMKRYELTKEVAHEKVELYWQG